jgi:glyoxylase I family protein
MQITRFFHCAINTKDLDKSVAFYEKLGFKNIQQRDVNNPGIMKAFGTNGHKLRYAHLRLGDDESATVLDVVEWVEPATAGPVPVDQFNTGLTRIALLTTDTDQVYNELKAQGDVDFITSPGTVMTPNGGWRIFLLRDPDGVTVQIVQLVPPQ